MPNVSTSPARLTIRQLFATTSAVAIGLGLAIPHDVPIFARLLGFAIGFYGLAICIFAFSASLTSPMRELLFFVGLPLYLCCLVASAAALITFLGTAYFLLFAPAAG